MNITQKITEFGTNKIIVFGNNVPEIFDMEIPEVKFTGEHNILCLEFGTNVTRSTISFHGSNSLLRVFKQHGAPIIINVSLFNNNTVLIGGGIYTNGTLNIVASDGGNVLIGDNCLFSFGIWLRTSDVHLILDLETGKRLNKSKDIIIGSNVWIGQNSTILKGSVIGSGSIVGSGSTVSKLLFSNTVNAGVPAKPVKYDVSWNRMSAHTFVTGDEFIEAFKK